MKPVDGSEVFGWPEFIALANRLMIDLKPSTTVLTITVPRDGPVRIAQDTRGAGRDYFGKDRHLPENKYTPDKGMWRNTRPPQGQEAVPRKESNAGTRSESP